jgi:hypothetical protein
MADGNLLITRIAFSDDEIDYSFGSGITYSAVSNYITSSSYRTKRAAYMSYDGTPPAQLDDNSVFVTSEVVVEPVSNIGFYTNIFENTMMDGYRVDTSLCLATAYTESVYDHLGIVNASTFGFSTHPNTFHLSGTSGPIPSEGIVFIRFVYPHSPNSNVEFGQNLGYFSNIYRYEYDEPTNYMFLDRRMTRYDGFYAFPAAHNTMQPIYFYPLSGYSQYYGSGTTTVCPIWNMNIVWKAPEIGPEKALFEPILDPLRTDGAVLITSDIDQTTYGSRNIGGIVQSLGLSDLRACGILHYSNSFSGDVYGDYFLPGATEVDIPHLLWHRNGFGANGASSRGGLKLVDFGSQVIHDSVNSAQYTLLKDGIGPDARIIGRVYFEMKIIAITDPEVLTALSAKNNRNWTLPPLKLELVSQTNNNAVAAAGYTGLAKAGKRYYVTYACSIFASFGHREHPPCAYIQYIDGRLDDNGNQMYIKATFPPSSFPFLRNNLSSIAFSGTGWSMNAIQLLVQEVDIADDPGVNELDPFKWKMAPLANYNISRYGNLAAGTPMAAITVNNLIFFATQEEYDDNGIYYTYEDTTAGNTQYQLLGLDKAFWQGDEEFFYGNVTTRRAQKIFVRNVHHFIDNNSLNTTTNPTYTSGSTYISKIMILDDNNKILGVGKPDRPIEKNETILIDLTLKSYY